MQTKHWYQSKTVWLNVITTILGIAAALQSNTTFDQYAPILGIINVIGNTVLRVYFTNTNIAASSTPNV